MNENRVTRRELSVGELRNGKLIHAPKRLFYREGEITVMKKMYWSLGVAAVCFIASGAFAASTGETKFKELCAVCHPNGGNIINPQKTLMKKVREVNKIKTAADIIKNMRNPGPGMTKFDQKTVSDKDAQTIAEYILKTF